MVKLAKKNVQSAVKQTEPFRYVYEKYWIISLDDMPELQEVEEDQRSPRLFQVGAVSHQELSCSPSTNWLAELANIATSPQSPLLKDAPHKRFVDV